MVHMTRAWFASQVAYERGQGVAYDMAESLRHYRLAADQVS